MNKLKLIVIATSLICLASAADAAGSLDQLSSCRWHSTEVVNDHTVKAFCPRFARPVSGGCWINSDSRLVNNNPFEGDNGGNLPEQNERWFDTNGITGWFCRREPGRGRMSAVVLCCGTAPEG